MTLRVGAWRLAQVRLAALVFCTLMRHTLAKHHGASLIRAAQDGLLAKDPLKLSRDAYDGAALIWRAEGLAVSRARVGETLRGLIVTLNAALPGLAGC